MMDKTRRKEPAAAPVDTDDNVDAEFMEWAFDEDDELNRMGA
jgi:hypothetical protein